MRPKKLKQKLLEPLIPDAHLGLTLSQTELIERVSWLIKLRWLAFLGVLGTIGFAKAVFRPDLPWAWLVLTACAIPVYNLLCYLGWRQVHRSEVEHPETASTRLAHIQITCDLVVLAALIHFSGGVDNPFAFYFVFHIVIASILLSTRAVFAQATIAVALFSAVAIGEYTGFLTHYYSPIGLEARDLHSSGVFVFAEIWTLATALYFMGYFATSIAANLRMKEDEVVRLSRQAQRDAEELRVAYDKLERVDQAKSAYTRKVAHELKSPLAAIETLLQVVIQGLQGEIPEKARDMIERARARAHGLHALVKDLLVLAAAREMQELSSHVDVDLVAVLEDVARLIGPQAESRKVDMRVHVAEDVPVIRADQEQMAELMTNLISNAVKYTPESGSVEIRLDVQDGTVKLEVADTGIGIAQEDQGKVFDEFYRTSGGKGFTTEGTGLGLSIVKTIVNAHHGTISLESEVGKGTTFAVTLPVGME